MGYMSERKYKARLKEIEEKNESRERKRRLLKERKKYMPQFKLPSTSKLLLLGVVLLCLEIVIFCEYVMIKLGDTSAMYALIGIPASLIPIVLGYFSKSKAENTKNGIVYETAMKSKQNNEEEDLSGNDVSSDEAQG